MYSYVNVGCKNDIGFQTDLVFTIYVQGYKRLWKRSTDFNSPSFDIEEYLAGFYYNVVSFIINRKPFRPKTGARQSASFTSCVCIAARQSSQRLMTLNPFNASAILV